ncbi:MAG: hypothetical protein ACLTDR_06305 [Adlercreutzia equolifaciens]
MLALFLVLFMALGLLIRPLMANVNRMVARQVRDGGLFNGEDVDIPVRPYRISPRSCGRSDQRTPTRHGPAAALCDVQPLVPAAHEGRARFGRGGCRLVLAVIFALTPTEKVWLAHGLAHLDHRHFRGARGHRGLRFSFERRLKLESLSDARPDRPVQRHGGRGAEPACMDARDAGFGGREHESDRDGARDGAEGEEARRE